MKTIDKEVAFLMKFKKRFKTNHGFLKAARDMANEGLIRLGSYDIVKRKLALNKRLTPKRGKRDLLKARARDFEKDPCLHDQYGRTKKKVRKKKEVIKHHVPKVTGSCEDANDPCAKPTSGGGSSCSPTTRIC